MRRVLLWLVTTVTVVVLLFGYHTSTSSKPATGGKTVVSTPAAQGNGGRSPRLPAR